MKADNQTIGQSEKAPEVESLRDQFARDRIAAQRRRLLMEIGISMSNLLRDLEQLDVAHVPAESRAGLETGLRRLKLLCAAKASALVYLPLSSAPQGSAAVSPRGAGTQP